MSSLRSLRGCSLHQLPLSSASCNTSCSSSTQHSNKPDITRENGLDERIGLIYRQLGAGPKNTTECPSFRWRAIPEKPARIMRVSETVKHVGGSTVQVYRLLRPREDLYVLRAVAP